MVFGFSKSKQATLVEPHAVSNEVVELIQHAKQRLLIVTPYFEPWRHLKDALSRARERGVDVNYLFRKDQLSKPRARRTFEEMGIRPMVLKRLHAKIYVSEERAILTSMNLYAASRDSIEFGLCISRQDQEELYHDVADQASDLYQQGELVPQRQETSKRTNKKRASASKKKKTTNKKKASKKGRSRKKARQVHQPKKAHKKSSKKKSSNQRGKTRLSATQYKSLKAFRGGMSVEEIAAKRSLKETTIYSHLARAIALDWEPVDNIYKGPARAYIEAMIEESDQMPKVKHLYGRCKNQGLKVTFGEVMCVVAGVEKTRSQQG